MPREERSWPYLGLAAFVAVALFLSARIARLERLAANLGVMHTERFD